MIKNTIIFMRIKFFFFIYFNYFCQCSKFDKRKTIGGVENIVKYFEYNKIFSTSVNF